MSDTKMLDEIVRRTLDAFPQTKTVVLFGSRSRGDDRADSDYDPQPGSPSRKSSTG